MSATKTWTPVPPHVHAYEMTDRGYSRSDKRLVRVAWTCTDCGPPWGPPWCHPAIIACLLCYRGWCVDHVPDAPKRRRARR
jgi:hypothetical protein